MTYTLSNDSSRKKASIDTPIMFAQQSVSGIYIIQDIFVAGIY